jgi:hypothetical protein
MIAAFWQTVRESWQDLSRQLWPPTPEQQTRDALAELDAELAWRYRRLVQRQCKLGQLRDRLAQHERRVADLSALLATGVPPGETPLEVALDLDRIRRATDRARQLLHAGEAAYRRARASFDRRKRMRQDLQRGLLVPAP